MSRDALKKKVSFQSIPVAGVMMSLFKPDRESLVAEFIPLGFDAPEEGFISQPVRSATPSVAGDLEVGGEAESSASTATELDGDLSPAPDSDDAPHRLSDEQLEEIEAGAYARGEAAGRQEAAALDSACVALEKAGVELARTAASQLAANREEMLALAGEMARLWVGAELRTDPALFADVIENVLVEVDAKEDAQIFLNQETLAAFSAQEESRRAAWSEKFGVSLLSDNALAPDEYRVETPIHRVDGRTQAICERLLVALSGAIEAAPPGGEE